MHVFKRLTIGSQVDVERKSLEPLRGSSYSRCLSSRRRALCSHVLVKRTFAGEAGAAALGLRLRVRRVPEAPAQFARVLCERGERQRSRLHLQRALLPALGAYEGIGLSPECVEVGVVHE